MNGWYPVASCVHIALEQICRTFSSCMPEALHLLRNNSPILPPHRPLPARLYFLFPWIWLIQIPRRSGILQYLSFFDRFTSLSIISSRPILDVAYDKTLILRLQNIPLCACVYDIYIYIYIYKIYIIFTCLSTNEHLDYFHILPTGNNATMTIDVHTTYSRSCFQFLWKYTLELDC